MIIKTKFLIAHIGPVASCEKTFVKSIEGGVTTFTESRIEALKFDSEDLAQSKIDQGIAYGFYQVDKITMIHKSKKKLQFYYRQVNCYKAFRTGGSFYSEIHILDSKYEIIRTIPWHETTIPQVANEEHLKLIHEAIKKITKEKYNLGCVI